MVTALKPKLLRQRRLTTIAQPVSALARVIRAIRRR
jgi:hypothetical protein